MADDASTALAAPQIAGTLVNPRGLTARATARTAGAFAAGMALGDYCAGAPEVPHFGRVGFLAVSADDLALVKTRTGTLRMRVTDEVLARVPRSAISAVALEEGRILSRLTIAFANGLTWEFDIPTMAKRTAEELVRALGPGD